MRLAAVGGADASAAARRSTTSSARSGKEVAMSQVAVATSRSSSSWPLRARAGITVTGHRAGG